MNNENQETIREKVLALIESSYDSDAAFERALGLADKTVNNWRRGRSASFMKMLPTLSEKFGVTVGDLYNLPLRKDTSELSEEELHLLHLYRKSRTMPPKMRTALREALEATINLYLTTSNEIRNEKREAKKRAQEKKK